MSFVHELRVRYGECDPQGIVFNANYLLYFDVDHLVPDQAFRLWGKHPQSRVAVNMRGTESASCGDNFRLEARTDRFHADHSRSMLQ